MILLLDSEWVVEEVEATNTMMLVPKVAREEEPAKGDMMAVEYNVEDSTTAGPNIGVAEVLIKVDRAVGCARRDS
jgi:hypothetical protein